MKFDKTGSYWNLQFHHKILLNLKYWFKGTWMFLKVISNYRESIVLNELTILSAWDLCHALQEPKMGKTLTIINEGS